MKDRDSGRIILVSSVIGKRGIPNYTAYAGSKFALHGMADALRTELLHTGVKVGVVDLEAAADGRGIRRRQNDGIEKEASCRIDL